MPSWTRIAVAARVVCDDWDLSHIPYLIRTILRGTPLTANDLQFEVPCPYSWTRITFVHIIALKIGWLQAGLENCRRWKRGPVSGEQKFNARVFGDRHQLYNSWKDLFFEFMATGSNMHHVVGGRTPFAAFLEGYLYYWNRRRSQMLTWDIALRGWLNDLQSAGVDLVIFGQTEEKVWKEGNVQRELAWGVDEPWQRVIGFSHGASPAKWSFYFSEKSDCFVGEFWDLVERPVEKMPCAWPDT